LPLAEPGDPARVSPGDRALAARAHGPGPPGGFACLPAEDAADAEALTERASRAECAERADAGLPSATARFFDALAPRLHGSAFSGGGAPYTRRPLPACWRLPLASRRTPAHTGSEVSASQVSTRCAKSSQCLVRSRSSRASRSYAAFCASLSATTSRSAPSIRRPSSSTYASPPRTSSTCPASARTPPRTRSSRANKSSRSVWRSAAYSSASSPSVPASAVSAARCFAPRAANSLSHALAVAKEGSIRDALRRVVPETRAGRVSRRVDARAARAGDAVGDAVGSAAVILAPPRSSASGSSTSKSKEDDAETSEFSRAEFASLASCSISAARSSATSYSSYSSTSEPSSSSSSSSVSRGSVFAGLALRRTEFIAPSARSRSWSNAASSSRTTRSSHSRLTSSMFTSSWSASSSSRDPRESLPPVASEGSAFSLTRWSSRVFQRVGRTTARPPSSSMASIACTLRSRRTVPFSAFVRAGTALGRKRERDSIVVVQVQQCSLF